jgi:hypothetical protein
MSHLINKNRARWAVWDVTLHVIVTSLFALCVYLELHSYLYVLCIVAGGVLIDIDHCIDHFLYFRKFNLRKFFSARSLESGKVYLFLHSWELIAALFLVSVFCNIESLLYLSLSLAIHLAIDNSQKENWRMYFLSYRLIKKFDAHILLPEDFTVSS